MQEIFTNAEFPGDCSDDGDGVDLVALHVQAAAATDASAWRRSRIHSIRRA
jgi:hypothetical protein